MAAIEFNPNQASDLIGRCYTCGRVVNVVNNHAGHFKSRGIGGSSGLYFNVKTIRLQCVQCNAFAQGKPTEFREHLVEEYDEAQVQRLEVLHKVYVYSMMEIVGLGLHFKAEVEKMCDEYGIKSWW